VGVSIGAPASRDNNDPLPSPPPQGGREHTEFAASAFPLNDIAPDHLIAKGLVGDPTAPVMGIAGATNMNS
jgi:hypothetical protein